jgi:hypothetical protein
VHARPEYLDGEIFLGALYLCTIWIPAVTGIDTSARPRALSDVINPFSRFNLQLMKIAFPIEFGFLLLVALAIDPGVPRWVGMLTALIVVGLLGGSVIVGLSKKRSHAAGLDPGMEYPGDASDADGLDYRARMHRLEDGMLGIRDDRHGITN